MTHIRLGRVVTTLALGAAPIILGACGASSGGADFSHGSRPDREGGTGGTTSDAGAGGQGSGPGTPLPHTLGTIMITPLNSIVELDLMSSSSVDYTARGFFLDGAEEDVSDLVQWSHSEESVGEFVGSHFNMAPMSTAGARTTQITATYENLEAKARLTIVAYRKSGPKTDFFFELPFEDTEGEKEKPLEFSTDVRSIDVFFNMDTTGSMSGAITNLRNAVNGTLIPDIRARIADTQIGIGEYKDFYLSGYSYGSEGDYPFKLRTVITDNASTVSSAVSTWSATGGNDLPESVFESMYQIATGEGLTLSGSVIVAPNHEGIGGAGFRPGTMPVIVSIGDAESHTVGEGRTVGCVGGGTDYQGPVAAVAHSRTQTVTALNSICAKSVAINNASDADACSALADFRDIAQKTGAMIPPVAFDGQRPSGCNPGQCCTGVSGVGRAPDADGYCTLVFTANSGGTGIGSTVVTGIQLLTQYAPFSVNTQKEGVNSSTTGVPLPSGKTTSDFIKSITSDHFDKPLTPPGLPDPTIQPTNFENVTPGTKVFFKVKAYNDFLPQTDDAQFFSAVIRVLAGSCTDLDNREVLILVPPTPLESGIW